MTSKEQYITKSKILTLYKLSSDDIADLECKFVKNPHYSCASEMCLYKLNDIIELFKIKYNVSSVDKIEDKIAELNNLKKQKKEEKIQKQLEKRKLQLSDPNMIQKIKNKVKKTSQDREDILSNELNKYGLEMRADSDLCNSFINGCSDLSLEETVNVMIEMDWFFRQTNYKKIFDKQMNKEWQIFNQEKKLYDYDYDQYNDMKPDPHAISSDIKDKILTIWSEKQLYDVEEIPKTIMHKIIDIRTNCILKIKNDLDNKINQQYTKFTLNMQVKKCDFCDLPAEYLCRPINSSVKCYDCYKINNSNNNTCYSVCKLKKHNYPWVDEVDWNPKYSISHAFDDHGECDYCGRRMFVDISYEIISIGKNNCVCNNSIKYNLQLENDIHCHNCDDILFQKGYELNVCSTKCKYQQWHVISYYSKKTDPEQQVRYKLTNYQCINCNKNQNAIGVFVGQKCE